MSTLDLGQMFSLKSGGTFFSQAIIFYVTSTNISTAEAIDLLCADCSLIIDCCFEQEVRNCQRCETHSMLQKQNRIWCDRSSTNGRFAAFGFLSSREPNHCPHAFLGKRCDVTSQRAGLMIGCCHAVSNVYWIVPVVYLRHDMTPACGRDCFDWLI